MKILAIRGVFPLGFVAAVGLQLLVGWLSWVAGWTTYGGFVIWFVVAIEVGGVAVAIWIQRLIFLPLSQLSAGLEVLRAVPMWRAWAEQGRMTGSLPPDVCRMGPDEAHYRSEMTRWGSWSWLDWGLVTAATGVAWLAFSSPELFR